MNISNLPSSIQKEATILGKVDKCPQLLYGPTEPNPGPIFPIEEAEADSEVIKSILNIENIIEDTTNIII